VNLEWCNRGLASIFVLLVALAGGVGCGVFLGVGRITVNDSDGHGEGVCCQNCYVGCT